MSPFPTSATATLISKSGLGIGSAMVPEMRDKEKTRDVIAELEKRIGTWGRYVICLCDNSLKGNFCKFDQILD